MCSIPPRAAALGERRKMALGEAAAALSSPSPCPAPLVVALQGLGTSLAPLQAAPTPLCRFTPRSLIV